MPRATENLVPKGQPYGTRVRQQEFIQQSAPARAPQQQVPPEPALTPVIDPELGDLSEVLFAPTERPEEPVEGWGPVPLDATLAFKVDVLTEFATLPYAGPEIRALLAEARQALQDQRTGRMDADAFDPATIGPIPGLRGVELPAGGAPVIPNAAPVSEAPVEPIVPPDVPPTEVPVPDVPVPIPPAQPGIA